MATKLGRSWKALSGARWRKNATVYGLTGILYQVEGEARACLRLCRVPGGDAMVTSVGVPRFYGSSQPGFEHAIEGSGSV